MAVDPIGGLDKTAPGYDAARQAYRSAGSDPQAVAQPVQDQGSVSVSLQRNANTIGRLGTVNEEKNLFAMKIRATDKALQEISPVAEKMKNQLDTIVKNWPPFPQDSSERKDILMSYASLRKEILSMTFPPPPPPLYEKNAAVWEKFAGNNGQNLAQSIPDITETATDSQVRSARDGIETLQAAVSQGRSELIKAVTAE